VFKSAVITGTIIKVHGLRKEFGDNVVLDNLHFDVKEGELFGLVGRSGSGKTTLLNTMVGLLDSEGGDVYFRDGYTYKSVSKNKSDVSRGFGFASEHFSVYPSLTVEENLDYFGVLHDVSKPMRTARINSLLKLLKLSDSREPYVNDLSKSSQKRLAIYTELKGKIGGTLGYNHSSW